MKKLITAFLVLFAALAFTGCMTTYTTTDGKLSYAEVQGQEKGHVAAEASYIYILHPSLIMLGDNPAMELDHMLAPELAALGADSATGMTVRDGFTFGNYILSAIVPFLSWGTVEVEGRAVASN